VRRKKDSDLSFHGSGDIIAVVVPDHENTCEEKNHPTEIGIRFLCHC
jgi:hypothetical protein